MGKHLNPLAWPHCKLQHAVHSKGSSSSLKLWPSLTPQAAGHNLLAMSQHKLPAPLVSLQHARRAGSSTDKSPSEGSCRCMTDLQVLLLLQQLEVREQREQPVSMVHQGLLGVK